MPKMFFQIMLLLAFVTSVTAQVVKPIEDDGGIRRIKTGDLGFFEPKLFTIGFANITRDGISSWAKKDTTYTVSATVRDNAQIAEMFRVAPEVLFAFNPDKAESLATVKLLSRVKYSIGAQLVVPRALRKWIASVNLADPFWIIELKHQESGNLVGFRRDNAANISILEDGYLKYYALFDQDGNIGHEYHGSELEYGVTDVDPFSVSMCLEYKHELPGYILAYFK